MWRQLGLVVLIGAITVALFVPSRLAAESQGFQTVTLRIEGMTCGACVRDVKESLTKVPSVSSVEIKMGKKWVFFSDYEDARALVTFDPGKTGVDLLVKAIEAASSPLSAYKARVIEK